MQRGNLSRLFIAIYVHAMLYGQTCGAFTKLAHSLSLPYVIFEFDSLAIVGFANNL